MKDPKTRLQFNGVNEQGVRETEKTKRKVRDRGK